ncbi:MAG: glycosyltransferase family 87 protein [Sphaerobacter thermophilus]|uniref:glycosyltransferase family 87 protein n=1 Tax=Sphaerobacter thermophilus TaxID=2057 RepID=UPI00396EAEBF
MLSKDDAAPITTLSRQSLIRAIRTAARWLALLLLTSQPVIIVIAHLYYTGLFFYLGIDWAMFWAAARAFVSDGPASVYNLEVLHRHLMPTYAYYGEGVTLEQVNPVPYPPLFQLLVLPFSLAGPVGGFVLWTLANVALLGVAIAGLARRVQGSSRAITVAALLLWWPVPSGLLVGQPIGLLVFAFYRGYLALERRDDLRAGCWLGVLLLKPQYLAPLVLVLLFKRRWATLGGLTAAGCVILASSFLIMGLDGVVAYVSTVLGYADGFVLTRYKMTPETMISWRGLLAATVPGLGEREGQALLALLSLATLALLPRIWRGHWAPESPRFAAQVLATMFVTLLVGYDVHPHGAAFLLVPGIAVYAQQPRTWWVTVGAGLLPFLPPITTFFPPPISTAPGPSTFAWCVILSLAFLVWHLGREQAATESTRDPVRYDSPAASIPPAT